MTLKLLALYQDVEAATAPWLQQHPLAACDPGCADCCRTKPPLVSQEEAQVVLEMLHTLPKKMKDTILTGARGLALRLAHGMAPEFVCPLLVDVAGVPRCAVYAARPYACRTFGHTARAAQAHAAPQPFTCARLIPRVVRARPPLVPMRSQALRDLAAVETLVDSYLPIWVGLQPQEWERISNGAHSFVVVGRPRP